MAARQETPVKTFSFRDRLLAGLASWLGWASLQFIGKTSRIRVRYHPATEERIRSGRPCLFAFWHRFQLVMLYEHRHRGVNVLVSRSRDGEIIARALHRFGYKTVRGSSSRGGGPALLDLLRRARAGESLAFTPDGPRGPFRSVQPGLILAAQKSGIPVVPSAWAGGRVKELKSWDRFLIPLPFGRYTVFYGEPVYLGDQEGEAREKIRDLLDQAFVDAQRLDALPE